MIRVEKRIDIPQTLRVENCNKYDGQDVQEALLDDQKGKCYLCEQKTGKSFQIEHLRPKADDCFPELKFTWSNLFLSCPYCNGRKPNHLHQLIDPTQINVEDIIVQRIDFANKKMTFSSSLNDEPIQQTISLLNKLMNGQNDMRDMKCEVLYDDISSDIKSFISLLIKYKTEKSEENKQAVIDSLKVDKEFLGFKYWIIRDKQDLYDEFREYLLWNKVS